MKYRKLVASSLLIFGALQVTHGSATAQTIDHGFTCPGGSTTGIYNYVNPGGLREAWTYNFSGCQNVAVLACCDGNGTPTNDTGIAYSSSYGYSSFSSHFVSHYGVYTLWNKPF